MADIWQTIFWSAFSWKHFLIYYVWIFNKISNELIGNKWALIQVPALRMTELIEAYMHHPVLVS